VEKLLVDLGQSGSIIVYSSYEKTQLKELAKLFPRFRIEITSCIGRLFDLQVVFKECFYHPDFGGQTSIKTTLPALTDLTYDDLHVQDGDAAIAIFARLMRGEVDEDQIENARRSLLQYCQRDTLAMVKLHDALLHHCR